jgi:hypothetical protein
MTAFYVKIKPVQKDRVPNGSRKTVTNVISGPLISPVSIRALHKPLRQIHNLNKAAKFSVAAHAEQRRERRLALSPAMQARGWPSRQGNRIKNFF